MSEAHAYCPDEFWVQENYVYLLRSDALLILDTSNVSKITRIGAFEFHPGEGWSFSHDLFVSDSFAYIGRSSQYEDRIFFIIDCSDPSNPKKRFPRGPPVSHQMKLGLMFFGIIFGSIILITNKGSLPSPKEE